MQTWFSKYWFMVSAIWYAANGILHDVFVVINHKGKYDRELLRLLMDGHVLIFSGILLFICHLQVQQGTPYGPWVGLATYVSMLAYCIMILPFLRSTATMIISAVGLALCIKLLLV